MTPPEDLLNEGIRSRHFITFTIAFFTGNVGNLGRNHESIRVLLARQHTIKASINFTSQLITCRFLFPNNNCEIFSP